MTIVHIVEPFVSGIAVFVKLLAESMPADKHIIIHGERPEVMCAREVKKSFSGLGIRFIKWHSAQRSVSIVKDVMAVSELIQILQRLKKSQRVDAVHLHSSKSGILGRLACRITGINQVFYTPNGASFLAAKNPLSRFLYKRIEKIGDKLGGKVVCCSASEKKAYEKIGISAHFINNAIPIPHQTEAITPVQKQYFTIVTCGRIVDQKNPALFNKIAEYFRDFEEFRFVWIGDGEGRKELRSPNIEITGWVNSEKVNQLVAGCNLYLSTSLYEGLSFAVLEALSHKKPVLLSNCTGNTDILKSGTHGDLFNTSNEAIFKILQYYNNIEMLYVMGEYSRDVCETEFNREINYRSYRTLYQKQVR